MMGNKGETQQNQRQEKEYVTSVTNKNCHCNKDATGQLKLQSNILPYTLFLKSDNSVQKDHKK